MVTGRALGADSRLVDRDGGPALAVAGQAVIYQGVVRPIVDEDVLDDLETGGLVEAARVYADRLGEIRASR